MAATKVNVLSPEIIIVSEADALHLAAGNILLTVGKARLSEPDGV